MNKSNNKTRSLRGFAYWVSDEMLQEYRNWPAEKKLEWLSAVNVMESGLPPRTRKNHEKFRKGLL